MRSIYRLTGKVARVNKNTLGLVEWDWRHDATSSSSSYSSTSCKHAVSAYNGRTIRQVRLMAMESHQRKYIFKLQLGWSQLHVIQFRRVVSRSLRFFASSISLLVFSPLSGSTPTLRLMLPNHFNLPTHVRRRVSEKLLKRQLDHFLCNFQN